ncbi:MAG: hypothetical protein ACK54H_11640, partial [Phycisphaerales bacterium]
MSYEVANAEPMPAGVITHRRLIRDPMTGDILAEILAEKSAATPVGMVWNPCAPNAWPLIPPSFMSGQFGSNINICNDANAGGYSHPMQVNSFVYDPLGRVIQKTKWGDPAFSRARGGDGCIPFGGTSAPIDGTSIQAIGSFPDLENTDELSRWDDVYPRTESLARNRFGLPSVVAGASGRATVIEYDDALRPVSEAKRLIRGGPMFGGVGDIAFSACEQEPPVRREYDGLLLKALLPSREQMACEQAKYERKYELDPLIWAEFMSDVPDASAPSLLSAKPDDNADCISLSTDDWVVKRDGFGEVVRSRDPAGNISDIIRDGAGRPVRLTITPGHGGAPTVRDFVYDDLGRGIGVVQQDETNGKTGSIRVFGLRGALINGTQYIESRGPDDVLRGMPDAMTCYSTRIRSQGWNGVETHLASFPGGLSERYGPSECHASLDGAIGRNGVIEVFESDASCAPGSAPAWLRMNVPYHGIANPAWFDVQPESSTGLSGTSKLLRVAMVATPEDVGANPTNEYNEPRRDFICAGIAGVCSTPLVDQEILRDPDGKILDVKDHVIEDSGRRVFYMDCTRAIEQFEGLFTRGYGESGGNFEEPDGAISRERVSFDRYGNVASYQAESAGASRELVNVANGHNQIVASEPAVPAEIEYDANGNLIRDGCGRRYEYDVENNLIRVFESAGQDERIAARFWYDGERRRIAAAYNDKSDGDAHTDAAFDNERIEHYAYDDLWRLRAVFVRDPESETAIWRERYVYDAAGINGRPTSARLDSPVAVQYNDDEDDDAERTSLIIANHLGDVIRLHHDDGTSIDVRYSLFGEPRSESFFADFNQDGAVDGDDVIVFFERWDAGDASADTD